MGKYICTLLRIIYVMIVAVIALPIFFFFFVVIRIIWTFDPKKCWTDWISLISSPWDEQSIYYSSYVESYWVTQTTMDFILNRKTWIKNPNYIPEDQRDQKTGKMISQDDAIRVISSL